MIFAEAGTVYRGGGRRWLTLKGACRAEARRLIMRRYAERGWAKGEELLPQEYHKTVARLARMYERCAKQPPSPRTTP